MAVTKGIALRQEIPADNFPPAALDRLRAADKAISEMSPPERRAAFGWLRSKFEAEWPRENSF